VLLLTLFFPAWERVQPSTSTELLAGSGGMPGGRETGAWIQENVPQDALFLTIGPSMANIIMFYGHRQAFGLSVSPNPLHRNPSYEAIENPDTRIRYSELQYLVWDSFSAARSPFFAEKLEVYANRYHGKVVHQEFVTVQLPDGTTKDQVVIRIYQVRGDVNVSDTE
jgi:hypothetical protein